MTTYFIEHLQATASVHLLIKLRKQYILPCDFEIRFVKIEKLKLQYQFLFLKS